MKITAEVRDYAAGMSDNEKKDLERATQEARQGMQDMSEKYKEMGSALYLEAEAVKKANEGL